MRPWPAPNPARLLLVPSAPQLPPSPPCHVSIFLARMMHQTKTTMQFYLGVMPGFYLLNQLAATSVGGYADPVYFTATAMIGMIALSGIVTRDSIILVDFMEQAVRNGRPLFDAILESRVVRLRPILLTAGAAMLSAVPITLDPIFSGLGWSLIFGLIASTIFTLFVIPVTYWLFYAHRSQTAKPQG